MLRMRVLMAGVSIALLLAVGPATAVAAAGGKLPPFPQGGADTWINSAPLRVEALRGKVVLIDVWTFDCWNCYRSFPWLRQLEAGFDADAFAVVGVHSPEFAHERDRENVREKVREFGLEHPIFIDNDHAYWHALDNRYWPAFHLVDKRGVIRARYVGETHAGDAQARAIEAKIRKLLAEPYP